MFEKSPSNKVVRQSVAVILILLFLTITVAIMKYQKGEIDYHNSDATWHVLLTVTAYDETPISDHLFLPIVTLGKESDKGIPWGATIPDNKGNYYYTSFSPAGYFAPWLFLKIMNLPVNETGLYIFNSFLFCLSVGEMVWLISLVYKGQKAKNILCLIAGLCYISAPELLHGMGVVYWHQSLLQVTLLLQIIMFYKYITENSRIGKYLFYTLALINPYIEWTGYIANVGFAVAEMIKYWRINKVKGFRKAITIGIVTIISFGIFSLHYLLRVDFLIFVDALKNRFMARNVMTSTTLTCLFGSYYQSFLYIWVVLILLLVYCFGKIKKLELNHGLLFFVITFPVMENIIMKQHALEYSYDRMKVIFIIIFLVCEVARNLLDVIGKNAAYLLIPIVGSAFVLNVNSYMKDSSYIQEVDYRQDNKILADYITNKYPDAVYASDSSIRGYMNLLFGRGIWEESNVDYAKQIAVDKGNRSIVFITQDGYKLRNINVYYTDNSSVEQYKIVDHNIKISNPNAYYLANFTDSNWTNGYSNMNNVLLFDRNDELLIKLLTHNQIVGKNQQFEILNIEFDSKWIRVTVDRNASVCMYPEEISIE